MKYFLVLACAFLAVAVVACNEEMKKAIKEAIETCSQEMGIAKEDFKKMKEEQVDQEKVACFSECILEKQGLIENGELNKEKIMEHAEQIIEKFPEKREEFLNKVKEFIDEGPKDTGKCMTGFEFLMHMKKTAHELKFDEGPMDDE
ncbi:general odorant-binding protein 56h [Orussus abietinus]|uniref:general odorant-binding protein 56h n=1 Tax=Orussus abietinus TaxID=222816 RepID=UPI0006260B48|nr:general odorant-binding protein 56h [Orussus abietinus]